MDPIFPFYNRICYFKVRGDRAGNEKYDRHLLDLKITDLTSKIRISAPSVTTKYIEKLYKSSD